MRFSRSPLSRFLIMLVVAALPLTAMANSVGRPSGGGASIDWPVTISGYEKVRLTVVSPAGEVYVKEFTPGSTPSFMLADFGGEVEEGTYAYELRVEPRVSASVKRQLANARAAGDDAAAKKIMRAAGLGEPVVQSGGFTVLNGSIVSPDAVENDANDSSAARNVTTDAEQTTVTTTRPSLTPETQDVVYNDDLIVTGSACVGFDCVNGESFGFDTIRMKENNTRIKFEDTSATAGFPTTDWELTANDSASGGANKFSITDVTAGTVPFTATGSAPSHSLFISSTGRIGNRTSAPILDLHIATGNTPAIRLDQTNSSGFTAQVWDIAGNEANFFVRDVTGGSRLPLRIRPGAPTSSLDINASGNVGMGTTSPAGKLHVVTGASTAIVAKLTGSTSAIQAGNETGTTAAPLLVNPEGGAVGIGVTSAANQLVMPNTGVLAWRNSTNSGEVVGVGSGASNNLQLITGGVTRLAIDSAGAVTIPGNLTVSGVKNFATPDPGDPSVALYYVALEGPEAGTYFRGTAKTSSGQAVIKLPGYFSRITEAERMTVQLTSIGAWGQLYVVEKTPEQLVVRVPEGSPDLEFDYFVQGVRKGYLDYEVERKNSFPTVKK